MIATRVNTHREHTESQTHAQRGYCPHFQVRKWKSTLLKLWLAEVHAFELPQCYTTSSSKATLSGQKCGLTGYENVDSQIEGHEK